MQTACVQGTAKFRKDQAKPIVSNKTPVDKPAVANEISDETGQYDIRFLLWRQFCSENQLDVAGMPSDLEGDIKTRWEELKEERLHKKAEDR
jgi:hypothetical protein